MIRKDLRRRKREGVKNFRLGHAHSIHNNNLRHLEAGYLATGAQTHSFGFSKMSHYSTRSFQHIAMAQNGPQGGRENFGRLKGWGVNDVITETEEKQRRLTIPRGPVTDLAGAPKNK